MSFRVACCLVLFVTVLGPTRAAEPGKSPVKVFVLAGQSNMQGYGHIRTLDWLGQDPKHGKLLEKIKKADGSYITRDDVWVYYRSGKDNVKKGNLTVGFGVSKDNIGPELMFGNVMGDHFDNQVLLIKTAWGGRSLAVNFRPPSAGDLPLATYSDNQRKRFEEMAAKKTLNVGQDYRTMIADVREVVGELDKLFPSYDGKGYEMAGFVWFQGWNDMIDTAFTAEYAKNLGHLIRDVRKDLGVPSLPVVVGQMGVDGPKASGNVKTFRAAQLEGVSAPEFKGNVKLVDTALAWDETAGELVREGWKNNRWATKDMEERFNKMGSQPPYHYLGSARVLALIGQGFGEAMIELLPAKR